ncbi:MAG: AEC family transporter [Hyphomicrobiales bacterium]
MASASPSGVNSYLFAQHFGTGQALSSNSISITTPLCVFTMTFWLWMLATYVL